MHSPGLSAGWAAAADLTRPEVQREQAVRRPRVFWRHWWQEAPFWASYMLRGRGGDGRAQVGCACPCGPKRLLWDCSSCVLVARRMQDRRDEVESAIPTAAGPMLRHTCHSPQPVASLLHIPIAEHDPAGSMPGGLADVRRNERRQQAHATPGRGGCPSRQRLVRALQAALPRSPRRRATHHSFSWDPSASTCCKLYTSGFSPSAGSGGGQHVRRSLLAAPVWAPQTERGESARLCSRVVVVTWWRIDTALGRERQRLQIVKKRSPHDDAPGFPSVGPGPARQTHQAQAAHPWAHGCRHRCAPGQMRSWAAPCPPCGKSCTGGTWKSLVKWKTCRWQVGGIVRCSCGWCTGLTASRPPPDLHLRPLWACKQAMTLLAGCLVGWLVCALAVGRAQPAVLPQCAFSAPAWAPLLPCSPAPCHQPSARFHPGQAKSRVIEAGTAEFVQQVPTVGVNILQLPSLQPARRTVSIHPAAL